MMDPRDSKMTDLVSKIKTIEAEIARNAPTKKARAIIASVFLAQATAFVALIGPYGVVFWVWGVPGAVVGPMRFVFSLLYVAMAGPAFAYLHDWLDDNRTKEAKLRGQLERAKTDLVNHSEWP